MKDEKKVTNLVGNEFYLLRKLSFYGNTIFWG